MIDFKNFNILIESIAQERGLSEERVREAVQQALAAAYKKEFGKRGQEIRSAVDLKTGKVEFWQLKEVVDEDTVYSPEELAAIKEKELQEDKKVRFNPERHIMLKEAKQIREDAKIGEQVELRLEPKTEYGRIATQTAKQVILQKIREAEREAVLEEFRSKEGELVSGVVQRVEGRTVFVDLGKTFGILLPEEHVPGEFYRIGQRFKFYLLRVEDTSKGPLLFLSRAYPKFISKLFELEVPEIEAKTVEIKGITREPGSRTKIAVLSHKEEVDPIGSMVGQRGTRVSAVINELGGEKIDIVEWAEEPDFYIANALSPAKVLQVEVQEKNRAVAIVTEDQLSLAIGRDGQNVRLAAKLTGWKIDVRTPEGKQVEMPESDQTPRPQSDEQ